MYVAIILAMHACVTVILIVVVSVAIACLWLLLTGGQWCNGQVALI